MPIFNKLSSININDPGARTGIKFLAAARSIFSKIGPSKLVHINMVCMHKNLRPSVRPCVRPSVRPFFVPKKQRILFLGSFSKWSRNDPFSRATPPSSKCPSFLELPPPYFYRFYALKKAFQQATTIVLAKARNFILHLYRVVCGWI